MKRWRSKNSGLRSAAPRRKELRATLVHVFVSAQHRRISIIEAYRQTHLTHARPPVRGDHRRAITG